MNNLLNTTPTRDPDPGSNAQIECLQCHATFPEKDIVYQARQKGMYPQWYCPTQSCLGYGLGVYLKTVEG